MKQIVNVLIGVFAGFLLAGMVFLVSRMPAGEPIALQPAPTPMPIAVDVAGAVARPGLYEFPEGSRVQNAIDAAGGLLAGADTSSINLAARLEDGQQLVIPFKEGASAPSEEPLFSSSSPEFATDVPGASSELININTATADELDALPGIGPTLAQRIVDYREAHGPFLAIEDIMKVSGIGSATFDNIKDLITVE
jgi:competence protein ComEA